MKINSKVFLTEIQKCLQFDKMSILDTIFAIKEKYNIHEDDLIELMKKENTLKKDLYYECKKNNMLNDKSKVFLIDELF